MATCIVYEDYSDGNIYYECDSCLACRIEYNTKRCPNCNKKFTKFIDEVEITHNHNNSLRALANNPNDNDLHNEVLKWGIQRVMVEF
jgi:hypothetical protein